MPGVVTNYQNLMRNKLTQLFTNEVPIETEWDTIQNIEGVYRPRIDLAVGPFSTERGGNRIREYDQLLVTHREYINRVIDFHNINISRYRTNDEQINEENPIRTFEDLEHFNNNARCFFAIEIENQVSRKHLLGGVVNASVLGRIAICIGWTDEKVKALVKVQAYWDFLRSVGKNSFYTKNVLILHQEQFKKSLD